MGHTTTRSLHGHVAFCVQKMGTICGLMLVMRAFTRIEGWGVGWSWGWGSGGGGCVDVGAVPLLQVVDTV